MRSQAVIGAGFGDEGKGHITDFLVSEAPCQPLVIRYNGGAQAGHTVVTPDGVRHVFGHFGSGTLAGAPTLLSRFFVVNPMLWKAELDTLNNLGFIPEIYIDPRAPLTTPYDMLANQVLANHGTCGLGIHETLSRDIETTVETPDMHARCIAIRRMTRERLAGKMTEEQEGWLDSEVLLDNYMTDLADLRQLCTLTPEMPRYYHYIFEGAQGLLLDEDHEYFPYVTHSKTGLDNVVDICKELMIDELEVFYVTRSYMTRHGPGPFPTEDRDLSFEDKTNVPNPFQGTLRFGWLSDIPLRGAIERDLNGRRGVSMYPSLAVTCLDQRNYKPDTQLPISLKSHGPSRDAVWKGA